LRNIGIAIHGGASIDSAFIRKNLAGYKDSLGHICNTGFQKLKKGKNALDTVFEILAMMEDDPLFNSGRGAALNELGKVSMDAAVMDGKTLKAGAVAMLERVKNPSYLIKEILKQSEHIFVGGPGALELAIKKKLKLMPDSYFITDNQVNNYLKKQKETFDEKLKKSSHGTCGVVIADSKGNLASGTSTGGTGNAIAGRIGDSCVLGAGCYANNHTCAVSATGDGEYLIKGVVSHLISCYMEFTGAGVQEACDYAVHQRNKKIKGELGVIAIDKHANIGISFNTQRMHRAWMSSSQKIQVKVYSD
jgi:L-asparaginase / beta-aspartyl-peptidase